MKHKLQVSAMDWYALDGHLKANRHCAMRTCESDLPLALHGISTSATSALSSGMLPNGPVKTAC